MEYAKNYEEQLFLRTNVVGYTKKFKDNIIKAFRINRLFAENKIRSSIKGNVEAVNQTFNYMALKAGKLKEYKYGFISTLHTFGRDLKFNPHLHVFVVECIIDKQNNVKNYNHFHYELMRKSFQKVYYPYS